MLPGNLSAAWDQLLFPTLSAWEAAVRAHVPVGIVVDAQLVAPADAAALLSDYPGALMAPAAEFLTDAVNEGLAAYARAGGRVLRLNNTAGWRTSASRARLQHTLLQTLFEGASHGPPVVFAPHGERPTAASNYTWSGHHVVTHSSAAAQRMAVYATIAFADCAPAGSKPPGPAPPLPDVPPTFWAVLNVTVPSTAACATPADSTLSAHDTLRGVDVSTSAIRTVDGARVVWTLALPPFQRFLALGLRFGCSATHATV
eukprot:m.746960 g.746960  ORF g.746960 m.746960 type:complete len:258 (+) comp23141_c0_seq3:508-1281(+)